jgi:hypothetical protein
VGDCAVIGGFVYRGQGLAELEGWYLFGDWCSGRIRAVNTADNSAAVILIDSPYMISSFASFRRRDPVTYDHAVYRWRETATATASLACPITARREPEQDFDLDSAATRATRAATTMPMPPTLPHGRGLRRRHRQTPGHCPAVPYESVTRQGHKRTATTDPGRNGLSWAANGGLDALKVLRFSAGLSVAQNEPCADIGMAIGGGQVQGDVDCSNPHSVNAVDALKILRAVAGLSVAKPAECPEVKPP